MASRSPSVRRDKSVRRSGAQVAVCALEMLSERRRVCRERIFDGVALRMRLTRACILSEECTTWRRSHSRAGAPAGDYLASVSKAALSHQLLTVSPRVTRLPLTLADLPLLPHFSP
eukprot:ctg_478.g245